VISGLDLMEEVMSSSAAPATSIAGEMGSITIERSQLVTSFCSIQPDTWHRLPHIRTVTGLQRHVVQKLIWQTAACHAHVHFLTENRHALQAKQDKFKGAVLTDSAGNPIEEQPPLLVDRRNPVQPLDLDASLQSSVLKEPVLEFAAIFSTIKLLPTAVANAVPSQISGAALAPPAAFQVSISYRLAWCC